VSIRVALGLDYGWRCFNDSHGYLEPVLIHRTKTPFVQTRNDPDDRHYVGANIVMPPDVFDLWDTEENNIYDYKVLTWKPEYVHYRSIQQCNWFAKKYKLLFFKLLLKAGRDKRKLLSAPSWIIKETISLHPFQIWPTNPPHKRQSIVISSNFLSLCRCLELWKTSRLKTQEFDAELQNGSLLLIVLDRQQKTQMIFCRIHSIIQVHTVKGNVIWCISRFCMVDIYIDLITVHELLKDSAFF
jgi:hypothetical protein